MIFLLLNFKIFFPHSCSRKYVFLISLYFSNVFTANQNKKGRSICGDDHILLLSDKPDFNYCLTEKRFV